MIDKIQKTITLLLDIIDSKRIYVSNNFNSRFNKKVLISYITQPFIGGVDYNHSNSAESLRIAEIFHELGYSVDVIRHNAPFELIKFRQTSYDVVFGLEPNFLNAVEKFKPKKSIYYATGANFAFQNKAEQERIKNLQSRRGVLLSQRRFIEPHLSSDKADGVICIGNEWTENTYKYNAKKITCIPASVYSNFSIEDINVKKSWSKSRKNFLWFGSVGAVHKGLDLVLEIFSRHPDLNLYVCGNVKKEADFFQEYEKELTKTNNIHFQGWVNPNSESFKELAIKCGFSILPSCSEGMNGAVLTCMNLGLIPLVTRECGLNVENCGCIFKNNSLEVIENEAVNFSKKSKSILKKLSIQSYGFVQNNNSINNFSENFKQSLNKFDIK